MVILNVFCNFLFIVKAFVADVANKKCFTINNFNLEIVLYNHTFTFFVLLFIYTVFMILSFNFIINNIYLIFIHVVVIFLFHTPF